MQSGQKERSTILQRKSPRLKGYSYRSSRSYHVVLVAKYRRMIFGIIENDIVILSTLGRIVQNAICDIEKQYDDVRLGEFVIMPNHVHMLLTCKWNLQPENNSDLRRVVIALKSNVSKKCGMSIWQRSYYDHIIRNEQDYFEVAKYIQNNPAEWAQDEFR